MKPANTPCSIFRPAIIALTICLLGIPAASLAAESTTESGVRLLEVELLPIKVTLLKAKCDQLVIAVGKTTLAHPRDTLSILHAALTRGVKKLRDDDVATLPCTCARRIFLASVAAAPRRASKILDLAMELYPDCTAEFAEALRAFDAQGRTDVNGASPSGLDNMNTPMGTSMSGLSDTGDGDGGFGVGFGPGFPGSPGFTGSGPSGGLALPPTVVTAVLNG